MGVTGVDDPHLAIAQRGAGRPIHSGGVSTAVICALAQPSFEESSITSPDMLPLPRKRLYDHQFMGILSRSPSGPFSRCGSLISLISGALSNVTFHNSPRV